jgi:predicted metal-dependent peptidase
MSAKNIDVDIIEKITPSKPEPTQEQIDSFDIRKYCVSLLMDEPFFAALSRRIDKISSSSCPTAGVRFNKSKQNFELVYNPKFFLSLENGTQCRAILLHEYYHIIFGHVTDRGPGGFKANGYAGETVSQMWNYAADLSINSFLKDMLPPDFGLVPGKHPFENYPLNLSAEQYYEMIKKDPNIKKVYVSSDSAGDHSMWDEDENGNPIDQSTREQINEQIKNILGKAVNECANKNSWGTVSESLRKDILSRLSSFVNWKNVLRYFIKQSVRSSKSSSIKKINKRFPYIHAGKKTNRTANIAVSIDQSGSVSDNLLMQFFSELNKLSELASFTVIPFDHEVAIDKIYIWKKGKHQNCERVLTGGTNFDAPTQYVNEHRFDGHIVLTDMCAPKPIDSKCQRIWLTTTEIAAKPYFDTNEIIVPIPVVGD